MRYRPDGAVGPSSKRTLVWNKMTGNYISVNSQKGIEILYNTPKCKKVKNPKTGKYSIPRVRSRSFDPSKPGKCKVVKNKHNG